MIKPVAIQGVRPRTPDGFPAKAVTGERVRVGADIFRDGHDLLAARVRWRAKGGKEWRSTPMAQLPNHRWEATIVCGDIGLHEFVVEAWTDRVGTWRRDTSVKHVAGQDISVELEEGALMVEAAAARIKGGATGRKEKAAPLRQAAEVLRNKYLPIEMRLAAVAAPDVAELLESHLVSRDLSSSPAMPLWVDRERALFSSWYELFPRSNGGFEGTTKRLVALADQGFDVIYLPPIHPVGVTDRKGRNNSVVAEPGDVGSPWAIGSAEGGHTAIEPSLGTFEDFTAMVEEARSLGMEISLDYALQCSPDHPWVSEHPEWFHRRPDGSIKFAENPPKKYQDIYPINFWPEKDDDRVALWQACREILEFWIERGIRFFRVDNPHTKPLAFWAWVIRKIQSKHPDVLFLAEAFTHPKMMARLAEVGFSQSYTYFTWRVHKQELEEYAVEVAQGPASDYMRPNFWPNTPDILSGPLRHGGPAVFRLRLLLAATMSPSYGIYSGYELYENQPARETDEEYLNSEKYEIRERDYDAPGSLVPFITRINEIRRAHPALQQLHDITFHPNWNPNILAYSKASDDRSDVVLVVVNLDTTRWQESTLNLDLTALGVDSSRPFTVYDELTGARYQWSGSNPYVRLEPADQPGHVLSIVQETVH
ncbi:MAG TPA: alpha-1,4-glucan--maltose-1-phosphate maltosyltransferase [Actinomycetota bacterium]|nr:alpha-1,4-glucan--maltose-1-phosphate maltosyltransferase [Actinomycetota bacterium]